MIPIFLMSRLLDFLDSGYLFLSCELFSKMEYCYNMNDLSCECEILKYISNFLWVFF